MTNDRSSPGGKSWSSSLFSKVCKAFDVNPIQRNFINMILPVKVVKSSFF